VALVKQQCDCPGWHSFTLSLAPHPLFQQLVDPQHHQPVPKRAATPTSGRCSPCPTVRAPSALAAYLEEAEQVGVGVPPGDTGVSVWGRVCDTKLANELTPVNLPCSCSKVQAPAAAAASAAVCKHTAGGSCTNVVWLVTHPVFLRNVCCLAGSAALTSSPQDAASPRDGKDSPGLLSRAASPVNGRRAAARRAVVHASTCTIGTDGIAVGGMVQVCVGLSPMGWVLICKGDVQLACLTMERTTHAAGGARLSCDDTDIHGP
jgi:hypothetical protein